MSDITVTEEQQEWVIDLCEDLSWLFGAGMWGGMWKFYDRNCEDNPDAGAQIDVDEDYTRYEIHIYPAFWEQSTEQQVSILLHEMCHIVTNSVKQRTIQHLMGNRAITVAEIQSLNERETSTWEGILRMFLLDKGTKFKEFYSKALEGPPQPKKKRKTPQPKLGGGGA